MQKPNQDGSTAVILDVLLSIFLIAIAAFAVWAYSGRQDYKNNVAQKVNTAVNAAQAVQAKQDQQKFDEEAKNPNKTYQGPSTYGSITFSYPKTWSAYVDETNSSEPINGYFHPNIVPGLGSSTAFALRAELLSSSYSQILQQFTSQIKSGTVKAAAYIPPKVVGRPNVQAGTKLDGQIASNLGGKLQGSMVVIQVRDKTLEISTESPNFLADFNNTVLPSLSFVP